MRRSPAPTPRPPLRLPRPSLQAAKAGRAAIVTGFAVAGAAGGAVAFASGEDHVDPPQYAWSHSGPFSSFDAPA